MTARTMYVTRACPGCSGSPSGCAVCEYRGVVAQRFDGFPPAVSCPRPHLDPDLIGVGRAAGLRPSPPSLSRRRRPQLLPDGGGFA